MFVCVYIAMSNADERCSTSTTGFVGLNGTMDLNIVIRSAVVDADGVHVGAGGAVVVQSDAANEYEEMLLKASAVVAAVEVEVEQSIAAVPPMPLAQT